MNPWPARSPVHCGGWKKDKSFLILISFHLTTFASAEHCLLLGPVRASQDAILLDTKKVGLMAINHHEPGSSLLRYCSVKIQLLVC